MKEERRDVVKPIFGRVGGPVRGEVRLGWGGGLYFVLVKF